MKTNLDSLFKTSKEHESQGVWLDFTAEVGFHVKRFGGENSPKVKQALAKYYKPYARMIENDTMPEAEQRKILIKVFVESSMLGWKGVEIDGKEAPFTHESAIKLFAELPELYETVHKYASDYANFKEDVGNF